MITNNKNKYVNNVTDFLDQEQESYALHNIECQDLIGQTIIKIEHNFFWLKFFTESKTYVIYTTAQDDSSSINNIRVIITGDKLDELLDSPIVRAEYHSSNYIFQTKEGRGVQIEIVRALPVSIEVEYSLDYIDTLFQSIKSNDIDKVKSILAEIPVDTRDGEHRTALRVAVKSHDRTKVSTDIIHHILSLNPYVNALDWLDNTPLNYAIENDDKEIISLLREHGATATEFD